jgi:tetratricopeptide (TPR) repeat protein
MATLAFALIRAAAAAPRASPRARGVPASRWGHGVAASRTRVVAAAESSADRLNAGQTKSQLEPNAPGEDTPENILRVSRGTSFEGLKSAYRIAMEAAEALEGDEAIEARKEKVEWAFDALIDQSRSFFINAVEKDPSDPDAQFRLGNFYQTLGKFSDAEKCYRECAAIDSTHVDAMNNLALLLQEAGKIDEAEAYYLRCVECDPKCVDAMFNWATLKLEHRQDLDGCRVLINQIVQINPELKEHKLVKALRGDDEDESGETFG